MIGALILGCGICTALPPDVKSSTTPSPTDFKTYEAAAASIKRDPDVHVKLALWCERHGLEAERIKHLALAILIQPDNATARGLLGLVADSGRWRKPDDIGARVQRDEKLTAKLAEYNARRAVLDQTEQTLRALEDAAESHRPEIPKPVAKPVSLLPNQADPVAKLRIVDNKIVSELPPRPQAPPILFADLQKIEHAKRVLAKENLSIGDWCEQHGLKAEANAHYTAAARLAPDRPEPRRRLRLVSYRDTWLRSADRDLAIRADARVRQANEHWLPLLRKLHSDLRKDHYREAALRSLEKIDDPAVLPTAWRIFGASGNRGDQLVAIDIFDRFDDIRATRGLTALAGSSIHQEVRDQCVARILKRDRRTVVPILLDMLREPLRFEVARLADGVTPVLFVEGERFNVERDYERPKQAAAAVTLDAADFVGYVPPNAQALIAAAVETVGLSPMIAATTKMPRMPAELGNDLKRLNAINTRIHQSNSRVVSTLTSISGQNFGNDSDSWRSWWADQLGYAYEPDVSIHPRPTYFQWVADNSNYTPPSTPPLHHRCFAAGTPVHTRDGLKPIEIIRVGDQVLSRDVETGALGFQPVIAVKRTPETDTLRVSLSNGERLVTTPIHRFWIAGKGWALARDLKPGDALRGIAGRLKVVAVEAQRKQDVFNFEVESNCTYFVGQRGVLVHDNSVAAPVKHPFDAAPETLAVAK